MCDTGNHVIRRIATNGIITTVAGTGKGGYSGDGGPALKAELNEPYEVRFDKAGNMYFVEMRNHVVRRVDAETQTITTLAGTGKAGYSGDGGPARSAMLNQPHSIQLDSTRRPLHFRYPEPSHSPGGCRQRNDFYVRRNRGEGGHDETGEGGRTPLHGPRAIDFDANGDMWIALREGNAVYRVDMKTGMIHHVAGTGERGSHDKIGIWQKGSVFRAEGHQRRAQRRRLPRGHRNALILAINTRRETVEPFAGSGARGNGPDGDALKCRMAVRTASSRIPTAAFTSATARPIACAWCGPKVGGFRSCCSRVFSENENVTFSLLCFWTLSLSGV